MKGGVTLPWIQGMTAPQLDFLVTALSPPM